MRTLDLISTRYLWVSASFLSAGIFLKLSLPFISDLMLLKLPLLYLSLQSWLTPPYLYLVINGIIITIAASSKFQQKAADIADLSPPVRVDPETRPAYDTQTVTETPPTYVAEPDGADDPPVAEVLIPNPLDMGIKDKTEEEDSFLTSKEDCSLSRSESSDIDWEYSASDVEKPSMSARIGHRKTVRSSPEGSRLRGVSKPKRNETLESTWKAITEGRPMPLSRHLKKSETFEMCGRPRTDAVVMATPVKKSETFKERTHLPSQSPSSGPGKLRRESSLSQDELNRKVEAFIRKFNDDMRLQRQESFKQYMDMVNRGAH